MGELLDTPPPGLDEAIAISKVEVQILFFFLGICLWALHIFASLNGFLGYELFQVIQFLESQEYSMFTRIVFDTAPTVSENCHHFAVFLSGLSF